MLIGSHLIVFGFCWRAKCRKTRAGSTGNRGWRRKGRRLDGKHLYALPVLDPRRPVLIAGPTASGKSALALDLARAQGGVVVNADALQVYDAWPVLTAQPSAADRAQVPHRLYGHVAGDQPYSVGHWLAEVADLLASGARLIVTGGTGLYFRALTEGLAEIPPIPPEVRAEASIRAAADLLAEVDAATLARIDRANPVRVRRAWEVLRATGRGLADWQAATPAPLLPTDKAACLVLTPPRDWLADRIDRRFDAMLAAGALDEARGNLARWDPALPSARAIGAADLIDHLAGRVTLDEATDRAKIASRQYAKRQRTWFRARMGDWHDLPLA